MVGWIGGSQNNFCSFWFDVFFLKHRTDFQVLFVTATVPWAVTASMLIKYMCVCVCFSCGSNYSVPVSVWLLLAWLPLYLNCRYSWSGWSGPGAGLKTTVPWAVTASMLIKYVCVCVCFSCGSNYSIPAGCYLQGSEVSRPVAAFADGMLPLKNLHSIPEGCCFTDFQRFPEIS